jgi:hypothetical protein
MEGKEWTDSKSRYEANDVIPDNVLPQRDSFATRDQYSKAIEV